MYKSCFKNIIKFQLQGLCSMSQSEKKVSTVKTMAKVLSPSDRLSSYVHPVNYKIVLEPNLESGNKFKGNVVIKVNVTDRKDDICLHSNLLEISNVKVSKNGKTPVPVTRFQLVPKVEQLQIILAEPIEKGIYNIDVDFWGDLSGFVGFYASYPKEDR